MVRARVYASNRIIVLTRSTRLESQSRPSEGEKTRSESDEEREGEARIRTRYGELTRPPVLYIRFLSFAVTRRFRIVDSLIRSFSLHHVDAN